MKHTVAIYVYPDVEVLDFAGPYEVFTTATRMAGRGHREGTLPFRVFTVAREAGLVRARAGLELKAEFGLADHPAADVLVVPGGVVTAELQRAEVIRWLEAQSREATITASVCTGAFLLAKAGLLEGKVATT
ncbi:MAG: DJ-1/PfpI family protein, partial [Verrucomicrobiales bacterium]|nr:DJ-1/PfpI family protein [Verrucomicrobiales bacterium]